MDFKNIPIFINCRDRVTMLQGLIARLEKSGYHNIHIVDTGSTYPPLLEFYNQHTYTVHYVGDSLPNPHYAVWNHNLVNSAGHGNDFYVYTDPDVLPIDECPDDFIERFYNLLQKYPRFPKVGFGLKIDDLPDCYAHKGSVIDWEGQYWKFQIEPDVYEGNIDTTFALYRPGCKGHGYGLRTGGLYLARHLPWYVDTKSPSEENLYYVSHAVTGINTWPTTR